MFSIYIIDPECWHVAYVVNGSSKSGLSKPFFFLVSCAAIKCVISLYVESYNL